MLLERNFALKRDLRGVIYLGCLNREELFVGLQLYAVRGFCLLWVKMKIILIFLLLLPCTSFYKKDKISNTQNNRFDWA